MQRVITRVTPKNFPAVLNAFLEVLLDNGGVNRESPEPAFVDVPEPYIRLLEPAERSIGQLTFDELQVLTAGEESEREALIALKDMPAADQLLQAFFDEFPEQ